jgi:hypothetical protein
MNPLECLTFTIPDLTAGEGDHGECIWYTREGDGIGLYHFAFAPDLPRPLDVVDELRLALSRNASASGAAIVEADVIQVDGCKAVRQCVKLRQPQSGMVYIGAITLPFRDFSFVLKIQCAERGMTGMREAYVVSEKLESGEIHPSADGKSMIGWMKDPYDTARTSGLARTLADDGKYDERFPDHPLSRARRFLSTVEATLRVSDATKAAAPFEDGRQRRA